MQKIKLFLESEKGKDILIVIIVILVGLASFELGRLSKQRPSNGLRIENKGLEASLIKVEEQNFNITNKTEDLSENQYFASKRGKKFYSLTCSAGKTIVQENRIYFSSSSEAEKAGYELSSSCR